MNKESLRGSVVTDHGVITSIQEYYGQEVDNGSIPQGSRVTKIRSEITGEIETRVDRQAVKPVLTFEVIGS